MRPPPSGFCINRHRGNTRCPRWRMNRRNEDRPGAVPRTDRAPLRPGDEAPQGTPGTGETVCPRCGGSGRVEAGTCPECEGTGRVTKGIGGG